MKDVRELNVSVPGRGHREYKGSNVELCVVCTGIPWKPLWLEQNEQGEGKDVVGGQEGSKIMEGLICHCKVSGFSSEQSEEPCLDFLL